MFEFLVCLIGLVLALFTEQWLTRIRARKEESEKDDQTQ